MRDMSRFFNDMKLSLWDGFSEHVDGAYRYGVIMAPPDQQDRQAKFTYLVIRLGHISHIPQRGEQGTLVATVF